jgi:hypothetical protein
MVDEVALGQIFSKYISFCCQFSVHQMFYIYLSLGLGVIGPLAAVVPSGPSFTTLHELEKKKKDLWETALRVGCDMISQVIVMMMSHVSMKIKMPEVPLL